MIKVYTGVPGSGKSYKMVSDLNDFIQKQPDVNIISNIRDLKLPHTDFDEMLRTEYSNDANAFFKFENQQKLNEDFGGPILYVLDECQLYFPRGRKTQPDAEEYFQRHRHLGHEIYLATQSLSLVNKGLIPLIEIEYNAVRRGVSFFGEMRYRAKSPQSKQIFEVIKVRPKKEVFELYSSFMAAEISKPRRYLWRLFIIPLLFIPVFYLFYSKYLKIPTPPPTPVAIGVQPQVNNSAIKKYEEMITALVQENNQMRQSLFALDVETQNLKKQMAAKVKRFLPVLYIDNERLAVDPDSNAIMPLHMIKRTIYCIGIEGNEACYYEELKEQTFMQPTFQPPIFQ